MFLKMKILQYRNENFSFRKKKHFAFRGNKIENRNFNENKDVFRTFFKNISIL